MSCVFVTTEVFSMIDFEIEGVSCVGLVKVFFCFVRLLYVFLLRVFRYTCCVIGFVLRCCWCFNL